MPLPADFNTVQLAGKYVDINGQNVTGTVTFSMGNYLDSEATDTTIVPTSIIVPLVAGQFSVNLPATNDPDITGGTFVYVVTEQFDGLVGRTYNIELPYDATPPVQLQDLAPASTPVVGTAYLTSAFADIRYIRNYGEPFGMILLETGEPIPPGLPANTLVVYKT